jgi:hypothetical protein
VITRFLFYFVEAGLLAAVVVGIALPILKKGLKILGYGLPGRLVKPLLIVWVVCLVAGVVGGELVGPTFLWIYKVTGLALLLALGTLLLAPLLSKHIRIERANASETSGSSSAPAAAVEEKLREVG